MRLISTRSWSQCEHFNSSCQLPVMPISVAEAELSGKKVEKLQQVESTFDCLDELLAKERQYFTDSVKKLFEEQAKVKAAKREEISGVLVKLESVVESTEAFLRSQDSSALLEGMARQTQDIEDVKTLASNVSTSPTVVITEMEVVMRSPEQFLEQWHADNFIHAKGDPLRSHLLGNFLERDVPINQTSSYTFRVDSHAVQEGALFTASILCCRDGTSEAVALKKITPEQYSLSFVPQKRGRHELHIMYNDTHICGSPISVYVTIPPQQMKALSTIEVKSCNGGIVCYRGKVYVSRGRCIGALDPLTRSFEETIQPDHEVQVCGIVVTQDHIFATDVSNESVVKMNRNGTVIKSVRGDDMYFPCSIQRSRNKKLYVCDQSEDRIQEDLNVIQVLGNKYTNRFKTPENVAFDNDGRIYVADFNNHRIQVLSPQGQHIRNVSSNSGELKNPVALAIHRNSIYVVDYALKRVSCSLHTGWGIRC